MPAPASIDAIQALTEWWGDMGVEVDDRQRVWYMVQPNEPNAY